MMKRAVIAFLSLVCLVAVSGSTPVAAVSYTEKDCPSTRLLLYPAWYNGMKCRFEDGVTNQIPSPMLRQLNDIWIIALNIVQWIIVTVGYAALFFIILSGFKYMIARGDAGKIVEAKTTLIHAITGLIVALVSTAIVVTVQAAITGGGIK